MARPTSRLPRIPGVCSRIEVRILMVSPNSSKIILGIDALVNDSLVGMSKLVYVTFSNPF